MIIRGVAYYKVQHRRYNLPLCLAGVTGETNIMFFSAAVNIIIPIQQFPNSAFPDLSFLLLYCQVIVRAQKEGKID